MSRYALQLLKDPPAVQDHLYRAWDAYKQVNSEYRREDGTPSRSFATWEYEVDAPKAQIRRWGMEFDYGRLRIVGAVTQSKDVVFADIAVRGTDNPGNWVANFAASLDKLRVGGCRGRVHYGFQESYLLLRDATLSFLAERLEALLETGGIGTSGSTPSASSSARHSSSHDVELPEDESVAAKRLMEVARRFEPGKLIARVSGHSLGAALATIAAYDLACRFGLRTECVTWASPRVGDREFCEAYCEAVPDTARFLNRFDPVVVVPSNPWDPNKDDEQANVLTYQLLQHSQKCHDAEGYCHVVPGYELDPDTSMSAFLLVGGVEALAAAAGCKSAVGLRFLCQPHDMERYEANLKIAIRRHSSERAKQWMLRPSVGTWLGHRAHVEPAGSCSESLMSLGEMILAQLGECGPRLNVEMSGEGPGNHARVAGDLLREVGVDVDAAGHASLLQILERGCELQQHQGGEALLEEAQAKMLQVLPLLAATAKWSGLLRVDSETLGMLEHSQAGMDLLTWGMQQLDEVERNPEMLKAWLQASSTQSGMTLDLFAVDGEGLLVAMKRRCWEALTRPSTRAQLLAFGIEVDTQGNVRLDHVLSKAQELLKTDQGAELLHMAQTCTLDLLSMLETKEGDETFERSHSFVEQMQESEQGQALLSWARAQTAALSHNPEAFRSFVASFDASSLKDWGAWGAEIYAAKSAAELGNKLVAILQSKEARVRLKEVGVEVTEDGDVELDQVLARGRELMETADGTAFLRSVQEQVLQLLSSLEAEADGMESGPQAAGVLQLEASGEGQKLVVWGREQLQLLRKDPEALKGLLGSLDADSLQSWGLFARQFFMKALQPWELLRSEEARQHLQAAGVEVDADGNVQLQQVLERGQELLDTPGGVSLLRQAQMQALNLIAALEDEASASELPETSRRYIEQLESSQQGRTFLSWGREHLQAAKDDPEALRKWFASMDLSQCGDLQEWGQVLLSGDAEAQHQLLDKLRGQCLDIVQSDEAKHHLREMGVHIEDNGDVRLNELIKNAKAWVDTEEGSLLLRKAQEQAVGMVPELERRATEWGLSEDQAKILQLLRQTDQGRSLLAWGEESFAAGEQDPEALKKWINSLDLSQVGDVVIPSDPAARENLLNGIKEQGLKFISDNIAYLKVPPIQGTHDGREYSLENIDLTSFVLEADKMEVEVLQNRLINAGAVVAYSGCESIEAPCPSSTDGGGDGSVGPMTIEDDASERLVLEEAQQEATVSDEVVLEATTGDAEDAVALVPADTCPATQPLIGKTGEVLRLHASDIGLTIPKLMWSYSQQHFPYMHGEGFARATVSGVSVSIAFRLERIKEVSGRVFPRLVMSSFKVDIASLELEVKGSYFSWWYNLMATYFHEELRRTLAENITERVLSNVSLLLDPLNEYVRPSAAVLLSALGVDMQSLPWAPDHEFEVTFKDGQDLVGVGLDPASLHVTALEEWGTLAEWNQAHPTETVQLGDMLVEVNSIRGTVAERLAEIQNGQVRTMVLLRQYGEPTVDH